MACVTQLGREDGAYADWEEGTYELNLTIVLALLKNIIHVFSVEYLNHKAINVLQKKKKKKIAGLSI